MSNSGTIRLDVMPLEPGAWLALRPTRVRVTHDDGRVEVRSGPNDYRNANDLLNRLHSARPSGLPFLQFVSYEGLSMWQFLPSFVWPEVFRAVELADILATLISKYRRERLVAAPLADAVGPIWAGLVRDAGVAGTIDQATPRRRRTPRALAGAAKRRLLQPRPPHWPATAPVGVLLATQAGRYWVPRPGGGGFYDEQFSPLVDPLRSRGQSIRIVDTQELSAATFSDRDVGEGVAWYVPGVFRGAVPRRARAHFAAMWRELRTDPAFRQALTHRGLSLAGALEPTLRRAFHETLPTCLGYLAGAGALLDATRPEVVVVSYEQGPHQRALLIEAARRRIRSVGLMHGMIFDNHYDYMHDHVVTDPFADVGFAVPQTTCVWGEFWRDVLIRRGRYAADMVAVTGNPRADEAVRLACGTDSRDVRARLGLPSDRRIVVVLTGNQSTSEFLASVAGVLAAESFLLVKPHPSDDVVAVERTLAAHGYGREHLHRASLADALLAADVVVSQFSTAALETMLLRRPLVVVNLDRCQGYAEPMTGTGLARYAETAEELRAELGAALSDEDFALRTAPRYDAFVQRWFASVDGRSAERIADVVSGARSAENASAVDAAPR